MNRSIGVAIAMVASFMLAAGAAEARGLGVEVWTDRGNEAVYQPGEAMSVKTRASDDSWLLVYEIDTEGFVHLLAPYRGPATRIEGGRTLVVPPPDADVQLVVQETVGQSYIVAIVSSQPFRDLPWYLRPYSPQEEALGYVGKPDEEEGVTSEGRIVGDPFVAMERIRRRVLADPDNEDSFGTSYTSYYVHTQVRYPRYICYDCHRPDHWAWWDGFDPYYSSCSVFTFRVNWSWYWGPSYWFGAVPYYVYVYRPDCPPRYTNYYDSGVWYSSWDGWNRWCDLWGSGGLRRYKTPPPAGYVPPAKWKGQVARMPAEHQVPPGFIASGHGPRSRGASPRPLPAERIRTGLDEVRRRGGDGSVEGRSRPPEHQPDEVRKGAPARAPAGRGRDESHGGRPRDPGYQPRTSRPEPRREWRPEPRQEQHAPERYEAPHRQTQWQPPARSDSRPPHEAARPAPAERPKDSAPASPRGGDRGHGGGRPDFPGRGDKR